MKKDGERYDEVFEQMELLGIQDITTNRQHKNGTVVWRLPIKNINNRKRSYIEVASMSTGYVRNQNSGYSNYQLNKRRETDTQYYPESEWVDGDYKKTGKFLPFSCRGCIMIPNEIDRLEYLIGYCLKNYYIKRANEVADGKYVERWYHDDMMKRQPKNADQQFKLNELQNKLANSVTRWQYDEAIKLGREKDLVLDLRGQSVRDLEDRVYELTSQVDLGEEYTVNLKAQLSMEKNRINDLENKLATIERIARINASYR